MQIKPAVLSGLTWELSSRNVN